MADRGGRVFLVGMMGAGKSSVGTILARRLGWRFVDSDAEIELAAGRPVAKIFEDLGEAAFRAQESSFLARAVTGDTPAVVSVGGGAVADARNRRRMRGGGTVVWLRAREETLVERVGNGAGRPLLAGEPAESIRRIAATRRWMYAEVADAVVDVDSLSPPEVADRVVSALRRARTSRRRALAP